MKNYIRTYMMMMLAIVGLAGCVENEGFLVANVLNGELESGGYIRFTGAAPSTIPVPADIPSAAVNLGIEDPNGNAASYTVSVYLPGDLISNAVELQTVNSFPSALDFTIADIASALGLDVNDINFGQQFNFVGSVTTTDGKVYDATPLDFNIDDGATGGGTSADLLGQTGPNGYRNALFFSLTVDCPSFDPAFAQEGIYAILVDQAFGQAGFGIQVLDGPGPNELTLVEPFANGLNVVVSFAANGTATVAKQHAWNSARFGEASVAGSGRAFDCVDLITLDLEHTVAAGSFGTFTFTIKLN